MCRFQSLFTLIALSIRHVNSWDIAITTADQIEFYSDGEVTKNKDVKSSGLTALAYDAVYNMLLFVDKQSDNASIFSYQIDTKSTLPLVRRKTEEDIQGVAFDPISAKLFWIDKKDKSIYWKYLKPGSKDVNLFLKLENDTPRAIAVDSCRGFVYWTNINFGKTTIERARIDGTGRKVIVNGGTSMPMAIAIDQQTGKLYWANDKEGIHYSIEIVDLDGKNPETVIEGTHHQPNALTVSKDSIYWIDGGYKSIWKVPKTARVKKYNMEPIQLFTFVDTPIGIVANYSIAGQTDGIEECSNLRNLSLNKTTITDSSNIPSEGVYCLHGIKVGKMECNCTNGYTGKRCEIEICQNYCLEGKCTLTNEGQPLCSCRNGFGGKRCERDLCYGYCLNDGVCVVSGQTPTCICSEKQTGERCETTKLVHSIAATEVSRKEELCNCTPVQNTSAMMPSEGLVVNDGDFVEATCAGGWDSVRDPAIMALGGLSGLLCVLSAFLTTRVLQLKKRPRIKKRIIVQKNSTPLTARPDQCEITIENCCNMNICETPCFEPRSTIRPSLLDAKPGKEEKKNLIANMELPDDY